MNPPSNQFGLAKYLNRYLASSFMEESYVIYEKMVESSRHQST